MELTLEIDRFGRVLLPKKLREAMHLSPGEKLHAHLEGDRLVLAHEGPDVVLTEKEGFPVLRTRQPITGDLVEDAREERIRDLW